MIEVNLLPGRQARRGRARFRLPEMPRAEGRSPWAPVTVVIWVVLLAGAGWTFLQQGSQVADLDDRLVAARAEHRRFRAVVAQKKQAERVRDSLLTELNTIRQIDSDRFVWPHLLEEISRALPQYTWLTNVSQLEPPADTLDPAYGSVQIRIAGQTMDVQAYTSFIRNLAASAWLSDVVGDNFATTLVENRPVTTFGISARYRVADSAFIRTVPVIQSVR